MATKKLSRGRQRWAILVGAGYCQPFGSRTVPAHVDVARVKAWLQGDSFSIPDDNIQCFNSTAPVGEERARTVWPTDVNVVAERQDDWPQEERVAWSTRANITKALQERLDITVASPEDRGFDHVLFYFIGHGTRQGRPVDCLGEHINPTVLTDLFEQMSFRGLVLTVIMNCCYSGRVQISETEVAQRYPGMGGLPRYNLLAACSPYQTAGIGWAHLGDPTTITEGTGTFFTTCLLNALNDNPRCTLKMIQRRAFATNSHTDFKELPMLMERDSDNCSFFDIATNRVLPSIPAKWLNDTTVKLAAGEAHGVVQNSRYQVYHWDATVTRAYPIIVKVAVIGAFTSAAIVDSEKTRVQFFTDTNSITSACQAVLIHPFMARDHAEKWEGIFRMLNLPNPDLPDIFSFGVIDGTNLFDVYNTTEDSHLTLRFKMHRNLQFRYVRLTVVQFTATGCIRKYYPHHGNFELVTPDAACEFEIVRRMSGTTRETSTFKAFITVAPTSFDAVEQARVLKDATTGTRDQEFGVNHQIPVLPETSVGAWEEFRDTPVADEFDPPARWRTLSVTIHTTRS